MSISTTIKDYLKIILNNEILNTSLLKLGMMSTALSTNSKQHYRSSNQNKNAKQEMRIIPTGNEGIKG